jgi:hypothetical protein
LSVSALLEEQQILLVGTLLLATSYFYLGVLLEEQQILSVGTQYRETSNFVCRSVFRGTANFVCGNPFQRDISFCLWEYFQRIIKFCLCYCVKLGIHPILSVGTLFRETLHLVCGNECFLEKNLILFGGIFLEYYQILSVLTQYIETSHSYHWKAF